MTNHNIITDPLLAGTLLRDGKIGVIPTESVYGLVASTNQPNAVHTVHRLKKRPEGKAFIVLIHDAADMQQFNIESKYIAKAASYWPGKISVIVPCSSPNHMYLVNKDNTLAFRASNQSPLDVILPISGPLVAPSANPHNQPPATNIQQAIAYFGDSVDFYLDGGECNHSLSRVVSAIDGSILRN